MKSPSLLFTFLLLSGLCHGQGRIITQSDQWTYSYEDLSDFLRKYPGVRILDYGTMGAPIVYRPWGLPSWFMPVVRDGVPENRRYDGMYDGNLQPATELDTIRYSFMREAPAGRFDFVTRHVAADSPYTEFQIREGYYGFGTVDFAHGQRVYRSATLEATGRMVWYNGIRAKTASRLNRLRLRTEVALGKGWHGAMNYGGSNVDSESPLHASGLYSEREEASLRFLRRDSSYASVIPSLTMLLRQDREQWGESFRVRELSRGWIARTSLHRGRHHVEAEQTTLLSTINFPGIEQCRELLLSFAAADSLELGRFTARLSGKLGRESIWRDRSEARPQFVPTTAIELHLPIRRSLSLLGSARYTETTIPIAWRAGRWNLRDRPLIVDASLADLTRSFGPETRGVTKLNNDRLAASHIGLRWGARGATLEVSALTIHRLGHFTNVFHVEGDTVRMEWMRRTVSAVQPSLAAAGLLPLRYGLRIESSWFVQSGDEQLRSAEEMHGFTRLYYERSFFTSPLVIRGHCSYEHIGTRRGLSDRGSRVLPPAHLIGVRISGTIRGVTLIWGTENLFKEHYELMPGYPMIAKEEYVAFIWRLWL